MPVKHPGKTVIVLASGYSVKAQGVDVHRLAGLGHVIGVNDSGILAPCDEIVSMDRLWMEARWAELEERRCVTYLRTSAFRVNLKSKAPQEWLHLFQNDEKSECLSEEKETLNGFNSGICAINRAYHLHPRRVFLLGFDMGRTGPQPYWHESYPWPQAKPEGNTGDGTYRTWASRFAHIAGQFAAMDCRVYNVSPLSAIPNFPKIDYKEFLNLCAT